VKQGILHLHLQDAPSPASPGDPFPLPSQVSGGASLAPRTTLAKAVFTGHVPPQLENKKESSAVGLKAQQLHPSKLSRYQEDVRGWQRDPPSRSTSSWAADESPALGSAASATAISRRMSKKQPQKAVTLGRALTVRPAGCLERGNLGRPSAALEPRSPASEEEAPRPKALRQALLAAAAACEGGELKRDGCG